MRHERICTVCQTHYSYCPHCGEDRMKPTWMFMFDSENCQNIFRCMNMFSHGEISKEDALGLLGKCDLTKLESFHPVIKQTIKELIEDGKDVEDVKDVTTNEKNDVVLDQETQAAVTETKLVEKKFSKRHKKNRY